MINTITREFIGEDLFNKILSFDSIETSHENPRRDSTFYNRWIFEIDGVLFPDHPELWGFWETNTFIFDVNYGFEPSDVYALNRVEKVTKVVTKKVWERVK